MIYCDKVEFGQIFRSFAVNSGAIRLKRPKNLTQIYFLSLRSVKSDKLLVNSYVRHYSLSGQRQYYDRHHRYWFSLNL